MAFQHFSEISREELIELAKKGGRASGEARQKRKLLREELSALLSVGDVQARICAVLIQKALDGDAYSFQLIRDSLGEKATEKLEVSSDFSGFREKYHDQIQRLFLDEMARKEPLYGNLSRNLLTYEEQRDLMQKMIEHDESEV